MISKADLLASMRRECDICVHLHGKIPPGGLEFRFTEGQRTTLELMRYLSFVGIGAAAGMVTGDWDTYTALSEESERMVAEDFPGAMEEQKEKLAALLETLTDEDLAKKEADLPWAPKQPLGRAILELALGSLIAYRMQLFLQAKAAGNASLATSNCWAGVDMDT